MALLFGLNKSNPVLGPRILRRRLAETMALFSDSFDSGVQSCTEVLTQLCATDRKKVDEIDFDSVIPALASLTDEDGDGRWGKLVEMNSKRDLQQAVPVVGACFCLLLEEDGVVSRSAFKAIQSLLSLLSVKRVASKEEKSIWHKFLESNIVSTVRIGVSCRNENARRFFVLLLRSIVELNAELKSTHFHTDLQWLVRNDQRDLDFFLNITHVQVHRRARALQRLRRMMNGDCDVEFSNLSVSSVLLPLAVHPIYESESNIDESFALEGIATVAAIARLLPWSKYSSVMWTHLCQFDRHQRRERYLVGLICALVSSSRIANGHCLICFTSL